MLYNVWAEIDYRQDVLDQLTNNMFFFSTTLKRVSYVLIRIRHVIT